MDFVIQKTKIIDGPELHRSFMASVSDVISFTEQGTQLLVHHKRDGTFTDAEKSTLQSIFDSHDVNAIATSRITKARVIREARERLVSSTDSLLIPPTRAEFIDLLKFLEIKDNE